MKKTLALLALVVMMFATGCGKTPQAVEDAKDNANAAVEEVKEKTGEAAQNAADAVNNAANNVANVTQAMIDDAKTTMASIKNGTNEKNIMALDGIVPGINYEAVTEIYGEPISYENQIVQFSNGIDLKVVDNVVQEVSTMYDGLYTPADIAVGMVDYALNDAYGDANSVTMGENGGVVYKYVSKDNKRTLEFVARDGYISEIKCSLNK